MENLNILLLLDGFTKLSPVQAIFFFFFSLSFLGPSYRIWGDSGGIGQKGGGQPLPILYSQHLMNVYDTFPYIMFS